MTVYEAIELPFPRAGEVFIIGPHNNLITRADAWYYDNILNYSSRTVERIGYYPDKGTLHIKIKE